MRKQAWWVTAAGAGLLVAGSLTATGAQASEASQGVSLGADLASRWHGPDPKGRGSDGYGGEHSGGSRGTDSRHWHHRPPRGGDGDGGQSGGNQNAGHGNHGNTGGNGGGSNGGGQPGTGGNNGGNGHEGHGGNGHHGGGGCHYPPSRTDQVVLSGPNHTHTGRTVTLTGKVTHNGCDVDGVRVGLYSSHDGSTNWVLIRTAEVGRDGSFSFQVPSYARHYYQSVVAGGDGSSPVASSILDLPLR